MSGHDVDLSGHRGNRFLRAPSDEPVLPRFPVGDARPSERWGKLRRRLLEDHDFGIRI